MRKLKIIPKNFNFKSYFKLWSSKVEDGEESWLFKKTLCETLENAVKEHPYLGTYLNALP
jgi:hypothetical protein